MGDEWGWRIDNLKCPKGNSKNKQEHIEYFIALSKKEGRGEIEGYYALKGFFTLKISGIFGKK